MLGGQHHVVPGQGIAVAHKIRISAALKRHRTAHAIGQFDHLLRDAVAFGKDALVLEARNVDAQLGERKTIHRTGGALQQSGNLADQVWVLHAGSGVERLEHTQRFEQLRAGEPQAQVALALQAASPRLGQHNGQRRFRGFPREHQIRHQGDAQDGRRLREGVVAPQLAHHVVQFRATVEMHGHRVAGVAEQCARFGQIQALNLGAVQARLRSLQGLGEPGQVVARAVERPAGQRHLEPVRGQHVGQRCAGGQRVRVHLDDLAAGRVEQRGVAGREIAKAAAVPVDDLHRRDLLASETHH